MITVYEYPPCGTCRKAKKWLEDHHINYETVHIVEHPPTKEQLRKWIQNSGLPIQKFFNTSGKKYRELQLSQKLKTMNQEEKLQILVSDGMLIKRPIIIFDDKITVGFKEEQFVDVWK